MARKFSRQREMIKRFVATRKDHPTADVVYMNVRKEMPNISLGTVYRNLMLLSDEGEIARMDVGDGVLHFDPETKEHHHFICDQCGEIEDLAYQDFSAMNEAVARDFSGHITGHRIYFHGLCSKCYAAKGSRKGVTS